MNNINFLGQSKFPLSSETLEFMKQMNSLTARMALVAGTNYIISGCETVGSTVTAGYVVLKGEILPFTGGALSSTVWVKSVKRPVTALGITYPDVYDTRTVEMGLGTEQVAWPFTRVETNLELAIRLDKIITDMEGLKGTPTGVINPFGGDFNKVPAGWEACMGQTYTINDPKYAALYSVIGQLHGGSLGNFKLPDLRGMFVAGWHDVDADYKPVGKKGGAKEVTLENKNLPPHHHYMADHANSDSDESANKTHNVAVHGVNGGDVRYILRQGFLRNNSGKDQPHLGPTSDQISKYGDSDETQWVNGVWQQSSISMRPPYYSLVYMIKL